MINKHWHGTIAHTCPCRAEGKLTDRAETEAKSQESDKKQESDEQTFLLMDSTERKADTGGGEIREQPPAGGGRWRHSFTFTLPPWTPVCPVVLYPTPWQAPPGLLFIHWAHWAHIRAGNTLLHLQGSLPRLPPNYNLLWQAQAFIFQQTRISPTKGPTSTKCARLNLTGQHKTSLG